MDIEALMADLRRDEGCSLHVYTDTEGYLTIGFGRMIDKRKGGGISMAEAEDLLENDIEKFIDQMDAQMPGWRDFSEDIQLGLANMAFNMGIAGLMRFERMFAALENGNNILAAEEALNSKWAKQVGPRADRIADLFRNAASCYQRPGA